MKALNELHDAIRERRDARKLYRAVRNLDPWIVRDAGIDRDHVRARAVPIWR